MTRLINAVSTIAITPAFAAFAAFAAAQEVPASPAPAQPASASLAPPQPEAASSQPLPAELAPMAEPTPRVAQQPAQPLAAPPVAQSATPAPEVDTPLASASQADHSGFFFNVHLGGGYTRLKSNFMSDRMIVEGTGTAFGLVFGGVIAPNLVLHGEVTATGANNPEITYNGATVATENVSAVVVGFGPGITYYFMPSNVYIGASLLATTASIEEDGETLGETDTGLGAILRVGKEIAIGKDTGINIGAQYQGARLSEKDANSQWTAHGFNVTVGFTYN